jgi:hydrogenase-4 component B
VIVVLLAGLAAVVVGGSLGIVSTQFVVGLRLQSAGALAIGVAGFWALADGGTWGASFTSELSPQFGVDGLTGFFLGTLGLVAFPALVFASAYLQPTAPGRVIGLLTAAFVLALAGVLCARDPLTFLLFWELMTLVPAAIILVGDAGQGARRSVFVYVAITHLGSAGVWISLLLLAHENAIGNPSALADGSGVQAVVALAAIIGFGTKAGVMPLHTWLPRAHPIAPAHVSALMSGVMIKVAIYGLVRVLVEWLGGPPAWVGALVLGLGLLSALGGVTYALFKHELKRLLAFHSIENVGIILLGLGACLLLRSRGGDADQWAAFALAAALLHTVNHAVFKALLFLGAGTFQKVVGTLELDRLGGLLRRMPWTGATFLVGAAAIAGLPPLNGFASEWLTLQALLHIPAYGGVWDGTFGAIALAGLAATAALAVLCFVKVVGLVLLGPPRRPECENATDPPGSMRFGLAFLAVACVALGIAPGLLFSQLVGLAPWAAPEPARPGLSLPGTGGLPTFGIAVFLFLLVPLLWLWRGAHRAAPAPSWASGQPVTPALLWTSAGFTKPLRLVLEVVLRPEREITVRSRDGVVQEVSYSGRVPQLADEWLYRPVARHALSAAGWARRLQSGHLGTYVAYLIALVLALLVAVRIGALG